MTTFNMSEFEKEIGLIEREFEAKLLTTMDKELIDLYTKFKIKIIDGIQSLGEIAEFYSHKKL